MIQVILELVLGLVLGAVISAAFICVPLGLIIAFEAVLDWYDARQSEAVEIARIDAERARAIAEIRETTNRTLRRLDDAYASRVIEGTAREVDRW